jgi:hypothetical protein
MLYVYLKSGRLVEIPEASHCVAQDDLLTCWSASGAVVACFRLDEVYVFSGREVGKRPQPKRGARWPWSETGRRSRTPSALPQS